MFIFVIIIIAIILPFNVKPKFYLIEKSDENWNGQPVLTSGSIANFELRRSIKSEIRTEKGEKREKEECKVIDGPSAAKGKPCILPFKFAGTNKTYNECTLDQAFDIPGAWCSTKVDANGFHISKNWGICDKNCPGSGTGNVSCNTIYGEECEIPFTFQQRTYFGCISIKQDEKYTCRIKTKSNVADFGRDRDYRDLTRIGVCSEDCRKDEILSRKVLKMEKLFSKLKENRKVYTTLPHGHMRCDEKYFNPILKKEMPDGYEGEIDFYKIIRNICKLGCHKERACEETMKIVKRKNSPRQGSRDIEIRDCEIRCATPVKH